MPWTAIMLEGLSVIWFVLQYRLSYSTPEPLFSWSPLNQKLRPSVLTVSLVHNIAIIWDKGQQLCAIVCDWQRGGWRSLEDNEATYSKQKRIMKWPHGFCWLGISRKEANTRQINVVTHQKPSHIHVLESISFTAMNEERAYHLWMRYVV